MEFYFTHSSHTLHTFSPFSPRLAYLELAELLLSSSELAHLEHIEAHGFREWPALANGHNISSLNVSKARRQMHAQIPVALLETVVLADKVQIITTDHNRPLHLHLTDHSGQDTAADGDVAGEGAFLVDVGAADCLLGGLEAKTDAVVQTQALLLVDLFTVQVDTDLLLERTLVLSEKRSIRRFWLEPFLTAATVVQKHDRKQKSSGSRNFVPVFPALFRCDYNWVGNLTFFTLVSADRHDFFIIWEESRILSSRRTFCFRPLPNTGLYTRVKLALLHGT